MVDRLSIISPDTRRAALAAHWRSPRLRRGGHRNIRRVLSLRQRRVGRALNFDAADFPCPAVFPAPAKFQSAYRSSRVKSGLAALASRWPEIVRDAMTWPDTRRS